MPTKSEDLNQVKEALEQAAHRVHEATKPTIQNVQPAHYLYILSTLQSIDARIETRFSINVAQLQEQLRQGSFLDNYEAEGTYGTNSAPLSAETKIMRHFLLGSVDYSKTHRDSEDTALDKLICFLILHSCQDPNIREIWIDCGLKPRMFNAIATKGNEISSQYGIQYTTEKDRLAPQEWFTHPLNAAYTPPGEWQEKIDNMLEQLGRTLRKNPQSVAPAVATLSLIPIYLIVSMMGLEIMSLSGLSWKGTIILCATLITCACIAIGIYTWHRTAPPSGSPAPSSPPIEPTSAHRPAPSPSLATWLRALRPGSSTPSHPPPPSHSVPPGKPLPWGR